MKKQTIKKEQIVKEPPKETTKETPNTNKAIEEKLDKIIALLEKLYKRFEV